MKFTIEVISNYPPPDALPLNAPINGKIVLVLAPDGQSLTPSGVQMPGLEDLPSLPLVKITKEE